MARFTITLNDDIHQKLKEQAERDHRTLGQEIAYLIELYVPAYQTPQTHQELPTILTYPQGVRSRSSVSENSNSDDSYYQSTAPASRKRTIE